MYTMCVIHVYSQCFFFKGYKRVRLFHFLSFFAHAPFEITYIYIVYIEIDVCHLHSRYYFIKYKIGVSGEPSLNHIVCVCVCIKVAMVAYNGNYCHRYQYMPSIIRYDFIKELFKENRVWRKRLCHAIRLAIYNKVFME